MQDKTSQARQSTASAGRCHGDADASERRTIRWMCYTDVGQQFLSLTVDNQFKTIFRSTFSRSLFRRQTGFWGRSGTASICFLTRLGLKARVSPPVNNWWWPGACWERNMATGGRRPRWALTWHTNTGAHTHTKPWLILVAPSRRRKLILIIRRRSGGGGRQVKSHSPELTAFSHQKEIKDAKTQLVYF